jgi:predicted RNA methylase
LPYVKKAYLIELNPDLTNFIKKEIKKGGWEDKVEFIVADATKVILPEKVDYIIGENMSIYCANEHQVQIFQHLRKFLKPKGKLIPEKIVNLIQLGQTDFKNKVDHYPIMFSRHLPTLLTNQKQVNIINLYKTRDRPVKKTIKIKPLLSGTANAVYLRSLVQCSEGNNFTGTDSLMPPTVVKLKKPVKLIAGKTVSLSVEFRYGTSLDEAVFAVKE